MDIVFFGDIVGKPGRRAVKEFLVRASRRLDLDLVVANGENLSDGKGLSAGAVKEMFDAGVDVLTGGNHVWDKKEGAHLVRDDLRVLRPANYPPGVDGRGWGVFQGRSGTPYAIVSLIGRVFMGNFDCPFRWSDDNLPAIRRASPVVLVDFHAEATSEKMAMAFHLDGRVSALVGTHTHVQTADARIMPGGTGYLTDAGMCGVTLSAIGMAPKEVLRRFLFQTPSKFEVAEGEADACGVMLDVDESIGTCRSIRRFNLSESEMRSDESWKMF